ncbi:MAG: hypothetical protein KAW41_02900 [Candidatus Diapherotrites archaeon]|nr:hypothetical protein [Candidatus Diapherotrites archaeon]
MFPKHIFRAYDIRGKYPEELDEGVMEAIGRSLGSIMVERGLKSIVMGRDPRWTSPPLAAALKKGLLQTEVEVFDCGETSFGAAVYCAQHYGKELCAYITPSHLPADCNGLKVFYGTGMSFMAQDFKEIGEKTEKQEFAVGSGKDGGALDAKAPYLELVTGQGFDCSGVKCVLDCGGAATTATHPEVFKALGMEVKELFCEKDPQLKVRDPKPSKETLGELIKATAEQGEGFGVAFDADGDRAVLVDETGNVLSADQAAAIVAKRLLAKEKGVIVATVECSMAAEDYLKPMGAEIIRVPVGHTYIMEAGKKYNALLGYEDSGHMVMPRIVLFDDPIFVVLSVAQAMKGEGKKLSELAAEVPAYPRKRVVVEVGDDKKFGVIEGLKERMAAEYEGVNTMDGVRIDFGDGWVLMRASNTEPIVRLTVEAKTAERVDELAAKFSKVLGESK